MKLTIWTMTIDHKHGVDTTVHATEDAAMEHVKQTFMGDEIWDGKGHSLVVAEDTDMDTLTTYLLSGANEVAYYGPDPVTVDVPTPKVEIIHQVHPDAGCEFSYYVGGERVKESEVVMLHTLDAGRGYDFADWAEQAATTKFYASETAWTHELDSYYGDPAGDQYIDGLPDDTEWLDRLEDEPENRAWWRTNYPEVPLSNLFEVWTPINDHDGDQRYDDIIGTADTSYWGEVGPEGDGTWSWTVIARNNVGEQWDAASGKVTCEYSAKSIIERWTA